MTRTGPILFIALLMVVGVAMYYDLSQTYEDARKEAACASKGGTVVNDKCFKLVELP